MKKIPCRGCPNTGSGMIRRDFLRIFGGGSLGLGFLAGLPVMAGPFERSDFDKLVPADKKLSPDWIKSLFERGTPEVYRGADLAYIGMPIGGLCAGQLYLGGDGKLWNWDLFNHMYNSGCSGARYVKPVAPDFPLEQGFSLEISSAGTTQTRSLDAQGFSDVAFRGEYPIGKVNYADPAAPVTVELEAFSPFVPLSWDDSSLPATVLGLTVKNISSAPIKVVLEGRLQNGAALESGKLFKLGRKNQIVADKEFTFLECAVQPDTSPSGPVTVFENWSKAGHPGWTAEGSSFDSAPITKEDLSSHAGAAWGPSPRMVRSGAPARGKKIGEAGTGKLTSGPFSIARKFILFCIGGGNPHGVCHLNLVVDGKVVRTATAEMHDHFALQVFDVSQLVGKEARIEIIDGAVRSPDYVRVGPIIFSDSKLAPGSLEMLPDFGTMGLALLGTPADRSEAGEVSADGGAPIGKLSRTLQLAPGDSARVDFVLAWYFPNLDLPPFKERVGRSYGTRFDSALAVARHVAEQFPRLAEQTRLWRDTWYDSTLPWWFLDRTFLNATTLATQTSFRFTNGRFYGWEGVGSCPGTCTHVWHYAQAPARLFPELERSTREMADYDPAAGFVEQDGSIGFRGEFNRHWAADGMAGSIVRVYREHQMSLDDGFLRRLWPRVKRSIQFLMGRDADGDGLLDGPQHNTLDADWYGQVAWLSGMYAVALRAGEEMAREVGDAAFAETCRASFAKSRESLVAKLFDGDYFINRLDPSHPEAINSGTGCEIDQVLGQGWSWQVGLGRIFPEKETRQALQSIWRYNFTPDAGAYRVQNQPGRWYAVAGEAGLLMCTFPRADWDFARASGQSKSHSFAGYFNECMNGFEYQAAGHMIAEGLVQEGLAVTRAVHDRYHPSKRNPWNEIECGDHYARSMASYGVFLAACGYEYHGPKAHMGFAPRLSPEDFRAPFTSAAGWGTYSQKIEGKALIAGIALRYGTLRLRTLAFELPEGASPAGVRAAVDGKDIPITFSCLGNRLDVVLKQDVNLTPGTLLEVRTS